MKLFITGGSGFIGRNLRECLSGKHEILAPTHSELELTDENAVGDLFNNNAIDGVVHNAVRPGHRNAKDSSNQLFNNTRMFFNLVRNSDRFGKMIIISSGAVYDVRHWVPKAKEEYFDSHIPVDEGGFSNISQQNISRTPTILLSCGPSGCSGNMRTMPSGSSQI